MKVTRPKKNGKAVRREWTKADVKELKAHSKARTPVTKISKETKRTIGALRQKALHTSGSDSGISGKRSARRGRAEKDENCRAVQT